MRSTRIDSRPDATSIDGDDNVYLVVLGERIDASNAICIFVTDDGDRR